MAYQSPPLAPVQYVHVPVGSFQGAGITSLAPTSAAPQYVEPRGIEDHLSVQAIIRSYQVCSLVILYSHVMFNKVSLIM